MTNNNVVYKAFVKNGSGAGEFAASSSSLAECKRLVRVRYGRGWKVTIYKTDIDDGGGWFEPEEVCTFVLRK